MDSAFLSANHHPSMKITSSIMIVTTYLAAFSRRATSHVHFLPLSRSFCSCSSNSFGGLCLYPCGLFLVHLHRSSHASSNVLSAFHPSSSFALFGLAVRSSTSPALLPTTSYGNSFPTASLNALIMWKTVLPLPVPRFQARTPGW